MKIFSVLLVVVLCLTTNIYSQVLLEENFDYTEGDLITDHGWVAHSDPGTDPIMVVSPGLSFAGHPGSGIGNAAHLNVGNGEDVHKLFTPVTSGAVYTSFMVKQDDNDADGYFFHYSSNPHVSDEERATVWVRTTFSGTNAQFGLSFGTGLAVYPGLDWTIGETYFFVLKYEIFDGADNDEVSLYIFDESSPPTSTEPGAPYIGPRVANGTTEINPGSINLRQHIATKNITVDGILVSTTWAGVVTDVISAETINPVEFNLSQNYPNPFNPSTTIKFTLSEASNVTLKIFNTLGEEVSVLVNRVMQVGTHEVNFEASQLNSGIYFYQLITADFVETKKMMLMK